MFSSYRFIPNNNKTMIPTIVIRQNNTINIKIKFERLKKNNLTDSILLYFSESGNKFLGTIKEPKVKAIETPKIYHKPNGCIGNSGATNKVTDNNENHSIENILAGANQLFKEIRLNIPIDPNDINGTIIPKFIIYFIVMIV